MHGVHHDMQGWIEQRPGLLWIETLNELGRALEVGKQHRDLLALAFQGAARRENLLCEIGRGVGEWCRRWCFSWRGGPWCTRPDEDTVRLIDREALALNELVFERFQMRVIELKLQLEGPIRQAAPLAQEGNRLIHHRDKVHRVSSLSRARPPCACVMPS
jgi:hypothetical protein